MLNHVRYVQDDSTTHVILEPCPRGIVASFNSFPQDDAFLEAASQFNEAEHRSSGMRSGRLPHMASSLPESGGEGEAVCINLGSYC